MSGLTELLARVEAATGPDRLLDGDLHNVLFGTAYVQSSGSVSGFMTSMTDNGNPYVERYTASIDAALALVERMLTGPEEPTFSLDQASRGSNWTCEFHWFINPAWHSRADRPTAPLAIIAALLRALISRTPATGGKP